MEREGWIAISILPIFTNNVRPRERRFNRMAGLRHANEPTCSRDNDCNKRRFNRDKSLIEGVRNLSGRGFLRGPSSRYCGPIDILPLVNSLFSRIEGKETFWKMSLPLDFLTRERGKCLDNYM